VLAVPKVNSCWSWMHSFSEELGKRWRPSCSESISRLANVVKCPSRSLHTSVIYIPVCEQGRKRRNVRRMHMQGSMRSRVVWQPQSGAQGGMAATVRGAVTAMDDRSSSCWRSAALSSLIDVKVDVYNLRPCDRLVLCLWSVVTQARRIKPARSALAKPKPRHHHSCVCMCIHHVQC